MTKHYNIAFIGMGSIGSRHLANVAEYMSSIGATHSIDLYRSSLSRKLSDEQLALIANQYSYDKDISKEYDVVFITNPTALHLKTLEHFHNHAKAFFIEKPVFSEAIPNNSIHQFDDVVSYVACPLRYNAVLQHIKQSVKKKDVIAVRAMSSSYLPDWRPGQDYRKCYSAHTDMGGGVDIDLIHEWDYLTWMFGMPTECFSIRGKYSELEINSNDTALYIARGEGISFELHLDYFGRKAQRTLDIFTKEESIHCDIIAGTVSYMKEGKNLSFNTERNAFQMAEIVHFFDIVEGRCENDSNIEHGVKVLNLTKAII